MRCILPSRSLDCAELQYSLDSMARRSGPRFNEDEHAIETLFIGAAAGAPFVAIAAATNPWLRRGVRAPAQIPHRGRKAHLGRRAARAHSQASDAHGCSARLRRCWSNPDRPSNTSPESAGDRSERITLAIIPAQGEVIVVTPAFEEPSVRETLQVGGDVRPWNEHENPSERIVQGLRDRGIASGVLAVEPTVRFFIVDGLRQASSGYEIVSGDALVRACRLIKSPAELALLQAANNVTLEALRVGPCATWSAA